MPELPEVQSIRNQLEKYVLNHTVESVEVLNTKIAPDDFAPIIGAKFKSFRRFGKVLVFDFDNGYSTVTHIKLTGQFIYRGPNLKNPPALSKKVTDGLGGKHTHIIFHLDHGGILYYNDFRRFGWVRLIKTDAVSDFDFIKKLGPEPLDALTLEKFKALLGATKRAVKVVVMDQSRMGGVGNIYANDALWDSQILPNRPANSLSEPEVERLFESIEKVLKKGIAAGGASELSFVTPDGSEGGYQNHFLAYGKQGTICPRCKKDRFVKVALGGRGTYFCPTCQK